MITKEMLNRQIQVLMKTGGLYRGTLTENIRIPPEIILTNAEMFIRPMGKWRRFDVVHVRKARIKEVKISC